MFKLKADADHKSNVIQNVIFSFQKAENGVGKGEQHILLFPPCFQKGFISRFFFNSGLYGTLRQGYPFPKRQILDSSKLKEFADDNLELHENGRKFFKRVENTVGKGETVRYEQFLLFPQCFQNT